LLVLAVQASQLLQTSLGDRGQMDSLADWAIISRPAAVAVARSYSNIAGHRLLSLQVNPVGVAVVDRVLRQRVGQASPQSVTLEAQAPQLHQAVVVALVLQVLPVLEALAALEALVLQIVSRAQVSLVQAAVVGKVTAPQVQAVAVVVALPFLAALLLRAQRTREAVAVVRVRWLLALAALAVQAL